MWEAIAANRRRSRQLLVSLAALLIGTGMALGMAFDPSRGPLVGAGVAVLVWLVMALVALAAGNSILLGAAYAHRIQKEDAPQLWNIVEEMTIAAGLPKMPEIYLIEEDGLNAFSVGNKPEAAAVAVTSGLLKRLNRDELQGVIAHEIGHVKNLDIRYMTQASVMVGGIALMSDMFFRSLRFGGARRTSSSDKDNGGGQIVLLLVAVLVAILAPIMAQVLFFACSRQREYLADASAARYTRFPMGLAGALKKISTHAWMHQITRATAPLFIINPLDAPGGEGWFATHPPVEKRIEILSAMGGEAGLDAYAKAFGEVEKKGGPLLSAQGVAKGAGIAARAPDPNVQTAADLEEGTEKEGVGRIQQVNDLLARIGNYLVIPCACGMKIKLPPEFKGTEIDCPKCGTHHSVPQAQLALGLAAMGAAGVGAQLPPRQPGPAEPAGGSAPQAVLRYQRRSEGWESFKCACGETRQLSPGFAGSHLTCRRCGREIEIAAAGTGAQGEAG